MEKSICLVNTRSHLEKSRKRCSLKKRTDIFENSVGGCFWKKYWHDNSTHKKKLVKIFHIKITAPYQCVLFLLWLLFCYFNFFCISLGKDVWQESKSVSVQEPYLQLKTVWSKFKPEFCIYNLLVLLLKPWYVIWWGTYSGWKDNENLSFQKTIFWEYLLCDHQTDTNFPKRYICSSNRINIFQGTSFLFVEQITISGRYIYFCYPSKIDIIFFLEGISITRTDTIFPERYFCSPNGYHSPGAQFWLPDRYQFYKYYLFRISSNVSR